MNISVQYFDHSSSGNIIVGRKNDSNDLDVLHIGSHGDLEMLRDLINLSIDQLLKKEEMS